MAELARVWFVDDAGLGALAALEDAPEWASAHLPMLLVCAGEARAAKARVAIGAQRGRVARVLDVSDGAPFGVALAEAMEAIGADFWQFCTRPCHDYSVAIDRLAAQLDEVERDAAIVGLVHQGAARFHLSATTGVGAPEPRAALLSAPERCFLAEELALAMAEELATVPDTAGLALALDAALPAEAEFACSPLLAGVLYEVAGIGLSSATARSGERPDDHPGGIVARRLHALRSGNTLDGGTIAADEALLLDACVADMLGWPAFANAAPERDRREALAAQARTCLGEAPAPGSYAAVVQAAGLAVAIDHDAADLWRARAATAYAARTREQLRNRRLVQQRAALQERVDELTRAATAPPTPAMSGSMGTHSLRSVTPAPAPPPAADPLVRVLAELKDALNPREALDAAAAFDADGAAAKRDAVYRAVLERWPTNRKAALEVSRRLEDEGKGPAAARVLAPALAGKNVPPPLFRRAWNLARRSDNLALKRDVAARAHAALPREAWAAEAMIRVLREADDHAGIVALARGLPAGLITDPGIALMAYAAARKTGSPDAPMLRERVVALIEGAKDETLWRSRLARLEQEGETALKLFAAAVEADAANPHALRDLVGVALTYGRIGQHAGALLKREPDATGEEAHGIAMARELFAELSGSIEAAAAGEEPWASLSTPGAVFEHVCAATPPVVADPRRRGLMMVGASLSAGGAERVLATLHRAARGRFEHNPVNLALLKFDPEGDSAFHLPLSGRAAHEILVAGNRDAVSPWIRWLPKLMAGKTQALHDHLRAHRPAAILASLDMASLCAGLAGVLTGVPRIVLHVHNMRPSDVIQKEIAIPDIERCYRALLSRPEVTLVGVSEAVVADYADWLGLPRDDRFRVIHNGFDFAAFDAAAGSGEATALRARLGLAADQPLIGSAMRFTELKRPDRWIEIALAIAAEDPAPHFILFGDGKMRTGLEARVAEAGMADRFRFAGLVDNLPQLIGALDLFVLTSRTEGLPNVLIEAQAAGVPVLTYDVGGAPETFADGVSGRVVREDSAEAMAEAIRRVLADRDWREAARAAGPGFVRDRFAAARMEAEFAATLALDEVPPPAAQVPTIARHADDVTTRFMILMQWGRVGSNLLLDIIGQSGGVLVANERLNHIHEPAAQLAWYADHFQIGAAQPSHPVIGAKENVLSLADPQAFAAGLREDDVRIIRMRRDDLAKAAISQIRAEAYAEQTRAAGGRARWGVRPGETPLGPIRIEPALLEERIAAMAAARAALLGLFTANEVLDLDYETIRTDLDGVVARVRSHLGLPLDAPFAVPFVKATSDDLREAVSNYDELTALIAEGQTGALSTAA